jgi:hypothetical protein
MSTTTTTATKRVRSLADDDEKEQSPVKKHKRNANVATNRRELVSNILKGFEFKKDDDDDDDDDDDKKSEDLQAALDTLPKNDEDKEKTKKKKKKKKKNKENGVDDKEKDDDKDKEKTKKKKKKKEKEKEKDDDDVKDDDKMDEEPVEPTATSSGKRPETFYACHVGPFEYMASKHETILTPVVDSDIKEVHTTAPVPLSKYTSLLTYHEPLRAAFSDERMSVLLETSRKDIQDLGLTSGGLTALVELTFKTAAYRKTMELLFAAVVMAASALCPKNKSPTDVRMALRLQLLSDTDSTPFYAFDVGKKTRGVWIMNGCSKAIGASISINRACKPSTPDFPVLLASDFNPLLPEAAHSRWQVPPQTTMRLPAPDGKLYIEPAQAVGFVMAAWEITKDVAGNSIGSANQLVCRDLAHFIELQKVRESIAEKPTPKNKATATMSNVAIKKKKDESSSEEEEESGSEEEESDSDEEEEKKVVVVETKKGPQAIYNRIKLPDGFALVDEILNATVDPKTKFPTSAGWGWLIEDISPDFELRKSLEADFPVVKKIHNVNLNESTSSSSSSSTAVEVVEIQREDQKVKVFAAFVFHREHDDKPGTMRIYTCSPALGPKHILAYLDKVLAINPRRRFKVTVGVENSSGKFCPFARSYKNNRMSFVAKKKREKMLSLFRIFPLLQADAIQEEEEEETKDKAATFEVPLYIHPLRTVPPPPPPPFEEEIVMEQVMMLPSLHPVPLPSSNVLVPVHVPSISKDDYYDAPAATIPWSWGLRWLPSEHRLEMVAVDMNT